MKKPLAKSLQSAAKTIYATFGILRDAEGELPAREVFERLRNTVYFTEWELSRYEKTGNIRWESILHFYTIDCIKAGFMQKYKGSWILTIEGEEALKLGEEGLLDAARAAYRRWRAGTLNGAEEDKTITPLDDVQVQEQQTGQQAQVALLQQYEEKAMEGIQAFLARKNPYEWQDLVAALLRAMGYFIAFNAKRGKDGGIDLIAYSDPLGTRTPRIKVQVKHRPNEAISIDVVKQLVANLNKQGDVGLFVTSGRFSSESERYSRESHIHIELIDFQRLVSLWQQHYAQLTDEEKNYLPLQPIYFLGVNE